MSFAPPHRKENSELKEPNLVKPPESKFQVEEKVCDTHREPRSRLSCPLGEKVDASSPCAYDWTCVCGGGVSVRSDDLCGVLFSYLLHIGKTYE